MGHTPESRARSYAKVKARRRAYFKNKCCTQCASIKNLELDHIVRATKISHNIWSWSEARRIAELKKCQPLCRLCHYKKTAREFAGFRGIHSKTAYVKWGCRCDVCKTAYSAYRKKKYLRAGN